VGILALQVTCRMCFVRTIQATVAQKKLPLRWEEREERRENFLYVLVNVAVKEKGKGG